MACAPTSHVLDSQFPPFHCGRRPPPWIGTGSLRVATFTLILDRPDVRSSNAWRRCASYMWRRPTHHPSIQRAAARSRAACPVRTRANKKDMRRRDEGRRGRSTECISARSSERADAQVADAGAMPLRLRSRAPSRDKGAQGDISLRRAPSVPGLRPIWAAAAGGASGRVVPRGPRPAGRPGDLQSPYARRAPQSC